MGYLRRTLNYPKRITLPDLNYKTSMLDPMAIRIYTQMIDNECSLEKEFIEFIRMNHIMVLCQVIN